MLFFYLYPKLYFFGSLYQQLISVVLAAASDRHKNYSALRGYPLREKNGCRSSRKCGYIYSKIRITFFENRQFKNDDSAHDLKLKMSKSICYF